MAKHTERFNINRRTLLVGAGLFGVAALPGRSYAKETGRSGDQINLEDGFYTEQPEGALTLDDVPEEASAEGASFRSARSASPRVVSLGGSDRYETVAKEARYAFSTSETVIVASGVGYADSIAASGLAGALACPILLVGRDSVPSVTRDALNAMHAHHIVVIGSSAVVSDAVYRELAAYGNAERLYGRDRYETQMAIYNYGVQRGLWSSDHAIVTSALGFADALSASPVAYGLKAPVFFCDGSLDIPAPQYAALRSHGEYKKFLLLGSTAVTSARAEEKLRALAAERGGSCVRLAGSDRYKTSQAIARYAVENLGFTWDGAAFACGQGPYDSLGGGVVQGKEKSVLLLADAVDSSAGDFMASCGGRVSTNMKFFGSSVVVPQDVRRRICNALGVRYCPNTDFRRFGFSRSYMAGKQVDRRESNGCTYNDYFSALDPDKYAYGDSSFYQFADISAGYSGLSPENLDAFVANNCAYQESVHGRRSALRGIGSVCVDAARRYGINEAYLLAHAIWESGWGCSDLATGWKPEQDGEVIVSGKKYPYYASRTYYNFFGIGAVDSNALNGGRAMAVKEGWTSPEEAMRGAAKWIADNYVYRRPAQSTLYFMKWDLPGVEATGSAWHEYCTGLDSWCMGISRIMRSCYSLAGWEYDAGLKFVVPVFAD